MSKSKEIIKVRFHQPLNGRYEYYFTNLAALYKQLTSQSLGICRQALINAKFYEKHFYANAYCIIETVTLN